MSDTFSVKAILSAEDSSFRSVFNNAQGVLSNFNSSTSGLLGGLSNVTSMVKSGLGFGILQGIGQQAFNVVSNAVSGLTSNLGGAISRYDTLKQFPRTMELMGFKTEETKNASEKLVAAIDGLPTTLDGITKNAQNIALITGNLDGATNTAIALNNAFLMSGSSTAEAERGLTQYVQMMSAGKVDMQSWRTLLETMSPALTMVAKSFGYTGESAKTDLYNALQSGEITFNDFNARLVEMNNGMDVAGVHFDGFAKLAKSSSKGIGTSIENLKTTVVKQMANTIEAFDNAGLSIADSLDAIKQKINTAMTSFIGNAKTESSKAFNYLKDAGLKTKDALVEAFQKFERSPAMDAVKKSLETITHNLGSILPNTIKALEPIIEGVASVASKVLAAISDTIAKVTGSAAFMTFCKNIGTAIEKVGGIVEKVIQESQRYIKAIISAANDVMSAFGKAFDAITNTAQATGTANKLYENFQKVLGFVKDALIKVAGFLEKHHGWILKIIEHLPQIAALILGVKAALLVIEKVRGFMVLIDQTKSFMLSLKDAGSSVGNFVSNLVSKFTGGSQDAGNQLANLTGRADTAWMRISSGASEAGGKVSSGLGGGFKSAATATSGAASGIVSSLGGIVAGVGAAVGIIFGIIEAVKKWKEEQYKAGQALHEMTEEESQFVEASKQTCQAYNDMKDAALDLYGSKEADIATTELLRDKYLELLDANGKVIEGKEELAEKLAGEMCESLGLEKSKVEELRGEYQNLIDSNGKVKTGYEERADEILGEIAQAWGLEKTEVADIISKNKDLIGVVNDVSEAKRESAKVEAINEAYKQSIQDAIKLESDHKTALELKQKAEEELAAFQAENGDNFTKYTDKQRGEYDKIMEKIDKYNTALEENEVAQRNNAEVTEIEGDARVAAAEGDAEALELCWSRLTEDMKSHTNASKEELMQQLNDTQAYLNERKAAYEKSGSEEDRIELERAQSKRNWAAEEYDLLLQNQDGYLTKSLEAQREAAQKELDEAQAHLDEIILRNRNAASEKYKQSTDAAKELVAQKKETLKTIEDDLQASLITQEALESDSLSRQKETTQQETTEKKNIAINNAHDEAEGVQKELSTIPDDTNKIYGETKNNVLSQTQETTKIAGAEAQNTTNAYKAGLFPMESAIGSMIGATAQTFLNKANDMKTGAVKSSQETAGGMVKEFSTLPGGLSDKATAAMNMTQQQLIIGQSMLVFSTVGMVSAIVSQFDTLSSRLSSVGSNAMIGLNIGLCSRAGAVYNTAASIANNVANTIAAALQVHSPSRLMMWMGEMTGQGLVKGLEASESGVSKAAEGIATAMTQNIDTAMDMVVRPDLIGMESINRQMAQLSHGQTFSMKSDYNYNGAFQATIEVPVNLNGREISRVTVDTDSQEQYFNKKRYGR